MNVLGTWRVGRQLTCIPGAYCSALWHGTARNTEKHVAYIQYIYTIRDSGFFFCPCRKQFFRIVPKNQVSKDETLDPFVSSLPCSKYIWLVVYLPLWKIWVRQLGWWHSQHMENRKIHVPNHQPDMDCGKSSTSLTVHTVTPRSPRFTKAARCTLMTTPR